MARKIVFLVLILLTAYVSYWFYQNFSWVEEQKEVGFQGIAKRKPLLAAEFFLRKMGVNNQSVNGLLAFRNLDHTRRSILIATQRETINQELSAKLVQWVKDGGQLIVQARSCYSIKQQSNSMQTQADFVYQLFGLCLKNINDDNDASNTNDKTLKVPLENGSQIEIIELEFPYLEVLKQEKARTDYQLIWRIGDDKGQYLMQYALGYGRITVLVTTDIFTNEYIDQYDHARFLLQLVQPPDIDYEVWLVAVDDMPPLWSWLWDKAWYVMFSLSLLLLLWLWRYPLRFGPMLKDQGLQRRKLLEHIEALAYYRWHYKQLPHLLSAVQEELWEQIKRLHPVIQRDKPQQAYALLAQISQLKQGDIEAAFETDNTLNEKQFEQKVNLLVKLKQTL